MKCSCKIPGCKVGKQRKAAEARMRTIIQENGELQAEIDRLLAVIKSAQEQLGVPRIFISASAGEPPVPER